jgi:hypothetical protein
MGDKQWLYEFNPQLDRIRVHFMVEGGQVTDVVVVQYEAYIDGRWREIVRFDEAHGFFHRDVLLPSGEQQKTVLSVADKNEALNEAMTEIKENWSVYRRRYEQQYYDRK